MEAMGEWTGMYTCTTDEADFMNHLLASYDHHHHHGVHGGSSSVSGDHHGGFWNVGPTDLSLNVNTASYYNPVDGASAGFCSFSQESSGYFVAVETAETTVDENNDDGSRLELGMEDATINTNSYLVAEETSDGNVKAAEEYSGKSCGGGGGHLPLETVVESHDESLQPEISITTDQKSLGHSDCSRKRSRPSSTDKNKRNTKARRNQKNNSNNNQEDEEEEESKGKKSKTVLNRQSSSITYCSEDESNNGGGDASSSKGGGGSTALNLNGKTRASRGAATDPQSLYARKRRERINERLRILQSLVPNGTKVDISTMLEEAVHYVKFLQLQIKLLSSDDMWMYAPIAYNGMDIGLDLKLNSHRL